MALIKRYESGKEVSEIAGTCPGCEAHAMSEIKTHYANVSWRRSFVGLLVFLLGAQFIGYIGCMSVPDSQRGRITPIPPTAVNMIGVRTKAQTGDFIVTSWPQLRYDAIMILNGFTFEGINGGFSYKCVVPKGIAILKGQDHRGKYFEMIETTRHSLSITPNTINDTHTGFFIPNDPSLPIQISCAPCGSSMSEPLSRKLNYEPMIYVDSELPKYGFAQTLTYLGIAQGQIRFVYKEFNNRMIRSAFTQELSFDYKPENEYSYKGARIIVHHATVSEIDYTLVSPFN